MAADYPKGAFSDYLAALRVARKHRPLTASELAHLRELWQTAEDDYLDPHNWRESRQLAREGVFFIPPRPPAWELLEVELGSPAEPAAAPEEVAAPRRRGAKSRWLRADLETIFVRHGKMSARELEFSGHLVEPIQHQRISELRGRGDIRVERGRLVLPEGTTADGGFVILPKRR